ncbi:MAG: nucleoside triphosphate pyrophosphohydrolase, partial [Myxococcota bacterium]|nr:nucleoside triphosphate pyrophosphohydrolase [Myxococcota bacterium]
MSDRFERVQYSVGGAPVTDGVGAALDRFEALMTKLRAECPWDRAQSLESLQRYLIEESAELLEALDEGEPTAHREELGDLLFQIVFQSKLRQEEGAFTLKDVIEGIDAKLRRRHPELFGTAASREVSEPEDRAARWERLKATEKPTRSSALDGVPERLSPLTRALVLGERAARAGFDWPDWAGPMDKIEEERRELLELLGGTNSVGESETVAALERAREHEAGDLLFSVVNLCRKLSLDPERALRLANRRFEARYREMERSAKVAGCKLEEESAADQELRWRSAKAKLKAEE